MVVVVVVVVGGGGGGVVVVVVVDLGGEAVLANNELIQALVSAF